MQTKLDPGTIRSMDESLVVMKFGGAAVATPESFARLAEIIERRKQGNKKIVVVVSAMGNMTDHLLGLAHRVNADAPKREMDMLLSVGERISISLLAMALAKRGHEAVSFTGSQSGIITSTDHSQAQIVRVVPTRLLPALKQGKIVIVAGFQGVSEAKEITTLGRGGSDTTAVALGAVLKADHIEFYKDVGGVFDLDPHIFPEAQKIDYLSFDRAIALCKEAQHPFLDVGCLNLGKEHDLPLCIKSFINPNVSGTLIARKPHLV